jgi:alpha-beta hydrolase superfamily lysophospholipase
LSQWSIDDSNVRGAEAAAGITVPLAVIVNSADDAAPAADSVSIFDAAASPDKVMKVIEGATHYYQGQPQHLDQAIRFYDEWLGTRGVLG